MEPNKFDRKKIYIFGPNAIHGSAKLIDPKEFYNLLNRLGIEDLLRKKLKK